MKKSILDDISLYDDFPIIGIASDNSFQNSTLLSNTIDEVSFSGQRQRCCVCFIDMMNSTNIASSLVGTEISRYYSIFLNAMATIIRNFEGKIIKNAGDCLIYYFPATLEQTDKIAFNDVFECCSTMIEARRFINAKLNEERLPPVSYRISADYGMVEIARSMTSITDDLFGSTMNRCAKINSKAKENSMVIGNDLYQITKLFSSFDTDYEFEEVWIYSMDAIKYPIYSVRTKNKRIVINPFKCVSVRNSNSKVKI
jgi:two-component system, OmpR family, response regulator ChvI